MKQKQIKTINAAVYSAQMIISGITEVGVTVSLPHNPAADINTDLVNQIMACGNHEQAKQVKATRRNALVDSINEAQKFIRATRDVFKLIFGNEYTELFTTLGFQGSLEVPGSSQELQGMLRAIISHLTANPTQEVGTLVTAAHAQAVLDALKAADDAIVAQDVVIERLMGVRDDKFDVLCKRISSVYQELRMQLGPLDERWGNFGFNKPGADETPEQVTGVQVTLIGPTAAAVKWPATVRAAYFRIWVKVVGVDPEAKAVGSPADLDFTIEQLPTNATVEVSVSAVNNGGESPLSEPITITTHA